MLETPVQQRVRLKAAQDGLLIWRNNVGALTDETGRLVRFGLGNETARLNQQIKSSDLIGITPVVVTEDMVGKTVGIFTAVETKKSDWRFLPSDTRAHAQLAFHKLVLLHGGYAGFASAPEHLDHIIGKK